MEKNGTNLTPDRLSLAERQRLFAVCDEALRKVISMFKPKYVIAMGNFAEERVKCALGQDERFEKIVIGKVMHPR